MDRNPRYKILAVLILLAIVLLALFCSGSYIISVSEAPPEPTLAPDLFYWLETQAALTEQANQNPTATKESKPKKTITPTPLIYSTWTPEPYPPIEKIYPITVNPSPRWFDIILGFYGIKSR